MRISPEKEQANFLNRMGSLAVNNSLQSAQTLEPFAKDQVVRVLVVDDDENDFHYLKTLFRSTFHAAYEVSRAANYEEGRAELLSGRYDAALVDYRLGGRSGLDLMREAVGAECVTPMILLTGLDSPEVDQEASAAGASDYLCKAEINAVQLERSLRYALRQAATVAALRKAHSQLQLFLQSVPCAVSIESEPNTLLFANETYHRHFNNGCGRPAEHLLPDTDSGQIVWNDRHWIVNRFRMGDLEEELVGMTAVEITDRVRAEEMLRRTNSVLKGILASLPVIVGAIDDDGTVLEASGRALNSMGLRPDDIVGANALKRFPEHEAQFRRASAGGTVNFLLPITCNGRTHHLDVYLIFDTARGRGAIGFAVDVTDRVRAEQARSRQSQMLAGIMQNLPAIAGRLDETGIVIEFEGTGLSRWGISAERVRGRRMADMFPQSAAAIHQALRGEKTSFLISGNDQKAGEWHAEFFVFFDAEHGRGAVFFGRDVSERKRLEKQLLNAADAEQRRIGADLHDGLGQQLTGIACLVTALRDKIRKVDSTLADRAGNVAHLVNQAIQQTRALARGLAPVQLGANGLQAALDDLIFQVQTLHGAQGRLEVEPGPSVPSHDAAVHLYRIAHEAIANAIRHGQARNVTVRLDLRRRSLTIEDDGSGFQPTPEGDVHSLGLRLMVYRAATIGGTLSIDSAPGQGTRITCTWFTK
ncbi:MAG TPA: PAS domain-containing protein [Opitutaceae bacterium]